jgi:hypothetical protein
MENAGATISEGQRKMLDVSHFSTTMAARLGPAIHFSVKEIP